jgi:hypothetical protein
MFENLEKMSIKDIDTELERLETGQPNPLHKSDSNDVSDRIKKLARALMQLGYLDNDPADKTLLAVAKVLGIDTRSIESRKVSKELTEDEIFQAGERAGNATVLRALKTNPAILTTASIKDIDEALGNGQIQTKRPW